MITFKVFNLITLIASSFADPIINFSNDSNYLYGGRNAKEGQFPHQISILYYGNHTCGGSIIDKKWVLTAAHCLERDLNVINYQISAGNLEYELGIKYKIKKFIIHEDYDLTSKTENDIALIKIADNGFNFSNPKKIAPIVLMEKEIPIGVNITISGWGYNNNWLTPDQLQFTDKLKNWYTEECENTYYDQIICPKCILCLTHESGIGTCTGDSGSPAQYHNKLVGIASFIYNVGCATEKPDVYIKVSYYIPWINNHIHKSENIYNLDSYWN